MVSDQQLKEIEEFFRNARLPKEVDLFPGTKIIDVPRFVGSHIGVLRNGGEKPIYDVFWQRLLKLKELAS
jgi:hypothetical protein